MKILKHKEIIIKHIRQRIIDEHRKHRDLDWEEIAARKIYSMISDEFIPESEFIIELPKEFDARPIDTKSGWKNNAKILAEIVTAINNEIYVEDESAEMEKIDIILEWLRKHRGK